MNVIAKFLLFQSMILIPFITGFSTQRRWAQPTVLSKRLILANLVLIEPLLVLWSIWGLRLSADLLFLPLCGVAMVLSGLSIGLLLAPLLKVQGPSRTTFVISASLSNHGFTMGGFLCYLLLGEKGLGLSFIFLSYFMPYIFLVIFPFARRAHGEKSTPSKLFKEFFLNIQNMPFYALVLAVILRSLEISRPQVAFPIDALLMLSIAMYYLSLGLNFTFGDLLAYNRDNFLLGCVRFLCIPLITLFFLATVEWGASVEAVILIEACMPAAIYSVVASVLFDLDAKRASSMFVFNTLVFLAIILPALFFLRDRLFTFIAL